MNKAYRIEMLKDDNLWHPFMPEGDVVYYTEKHPADVQMSQLLMMAKMNNYSPKLRVVLVHLATGQVIN